MISMDSLYQNGQYLDSNPDWHAADAPWKARQILKIMDKYQLAPSNICEIGCGSGEILNHLYLNLSPNVKLDGYDISPQAYDLCKGKSKERLQYHLKDILLENNTFYDIVLVIDVFEHIEDSFGFLRKIRSKGNYKIFHIPLEISVQTVIRRRAILQQRERFGHIHFYTKDTAIRILKDTGYEIIHYFYTPISLDIPNRNIKSKLLEVPRKILFSINKDFTVRLLGGFSLMVLTR